jgi:hypothetical protein
MNQSEVQNIAVQEAKLHQLAALVNMGLRVLSLQMLTLLGVLLTAGIFGWAVYTESMIRIAGAAIFAVAIWCLIYLRPRGGGT